jgi:hypothetical protein
MVSLGKGLMKHIWRFQQVGGLVSVTLMCLNLTVLLYAYIAWWFESIGIPHKWDWLIMMIIFLIAFSIALLFGIVYDKVFRLWRHREVVAAERNPYMKGRIKPTELVSWQYINIPLLMKHGLKEEAEFNLKWNERNMERDPELRKDVYRMMKWINDFKLKEVDDRWLRDISEITQKKYRKKYGKFRPDW